jgi:hypothetical protein
MTAWLAIDPGSEQSAWVLFAEAKPVNFGIEPNPDLLRHLHNWHELPPFDRVAIEKVESFGMAVGAEVFETVFWSGRFAEAIRNLPLVRVGRRAVKLHLCSDSRAKDANIRAALIDRYGGPGATKKGGPLYGVSKDVWAALAVAVTASEGAA